MSFSGPCASKQPTNQPTHVKAAYLRCPVRPFIPNPLRCFKCQRFGHSKDSCRGSLACARCSQLGHDNSSCTAPENCINCKGSHSSFSRSCPKFLLEKEIQNLKVTKNMSYFEARRSVESRSPTAGLSYSTVLQTKKVLKTVSTQTGSDEIQVSPGPYRWSVQHSTVKHQNSNQNVNSEVSSQLLNQDLNKNMLNPKEITSVLPQFLNESTSEISSSQPKSLQTTSQTPNQPVNKEKSLPQSKKSKKPKELSKIPILPSSSNHSVSNSNAKQSLNKITKKKTNIALGKCPESTKKFKDASYFLKHPIPPDNADDAMDLYNNSDLSDSDADITDNTLVPSTSA